MNGTTPNPDPKPGKVRSPDRQDRLAERLRENLKKRKEQARAREGKTDDQAS